MTTGTTTGRSGRPWSSTSTRRPPARRRTASSPFGYHDLYQAFLDAGSADAFARKSGADRLPAWRRLVEHPAYTDYWKLQAVDQALLKATREVPTLHVHGLFDQEDIYGPIVAYAALERKDTANPATTSCSDPGTTASRPAMPPRSDHCSGAPTPASTSATRCCSRSGTSTSRACRPRRPAPAVLAFDTGDHRWREFDVWPPKAIQPRKLYLQPSGGLAFTAPPAAAAADASTAFVSDPAKPVPYRVPPIRPLWADGLDRGGAGWSTTNDPSPSAPTSWCSRASR